MYPGVGRAPVYTLVSRVASTIFVIVVLLRFFVPLAIPRFPLPAIFACLVLDAADQSIFQAFTDDPLPGYQAYDKALDVFYLAIAYISSMRNWREATAFQVGRFLYLYRLVGVTLFELLHWRWLLLVFPNTFEYFFIAYEAVRTRWNPARLSALAVVTMAVFITVFIKLPQEWWIHIAQLDFTEFMADHPYLWFVLAGLVVAAGVVYWRYRSRLPVADWAFTVDVDRHLPELPAGPPVPERFWSPVLIEKVVLLALISVIFAQVLPDVRASNLGVAIGVALLVVLNASVSQFLRSRGRSWSTSAQEFAAMLVINTGIVTLDSILGRGNETPALSTLFFVLLLSLLIALFDRFRATREPDVARTRPITTALAQWRSRSHG
jgi:hypothetical protein